MKVLLAFGLAFAFFIPFRNVLAFDPNYILSDAEFLDADAMNLDQIQAFLKRGSLADLRTEDTDGKIRKASEIIWRAAQEHGINPKFLLVTLQKEQSLVEDSDPTQKQLDWAMGYAICDNCSMSDPSLSRWKGFGKQVNSAAMQFTDGYIQDINNTGKAAGKYGPGISVMIDGERVTPYNAATASMYAYTPHLHGNKNFLAIWNRWFGREYPSGSLLQAVNEPGVWLIENGYRRPITSASALNSRFNADLILSVSPTDLEQFPVGRAISLPNYTLVKDETGRISLLVDDTLRHIETMDALRANFGYADDMIVDIHSHEAAEYAEGEPITLDSSHPQGKLLQLKTTGAVFFIEDGTRHAVLDRAVLQARFPNASLTAVDPVEIEQYAEGKPVALPDGYLIRSADEPAVYVVSDGERRLIPSESVFLSYGYKWDNVVFVSDFTVSQLPLGQNLVDTGTEN